jgi:serine/threonine-protein kinase
VKIVDFGIAKVAPIPGSAAEPRLTRAGSVFGTPEYMAPEQVAGEPVDARCDLYALGCVLYELVTGSRPFEGSPVVVMGKQLREQPERPRTRAPEACLPPDIEAVIMKALAKSKEDRYPTAREMREALESALIAPDRRRSRAKRIVAAALLGSLGVLAAAGLKDHTQRIKDFVASGARSSTPVAAVPVGVLSTAAPTEPAQPTAPTQAAAEGAEPALMAATAASMSATSPTSPVPTESVAALADREPRTNAPAALVPQEGADDGSSSKGSTKGEAEPRSSAAASLLVRAAARHDPDMKARLDDARAAAKEHTSDPRALKAWATAALQAGEAKEARRAAEAWASHDGSAEPRLFLAAALEASGRRREARSVLEDWVANHPESSDAKRMLQHLGASPEPAIKRHSRTRSTFSPSRSSGRSSIHPPDPSSDGQ